MIDPQLLSYIKQQKTQGINNEQIKSSLLANGWPSASIDEAIASLETPTTPPVFTSSPQPRVTPTQNAVVYQTRTESPVWKILAIIIILVFILGIGAFVASKTILKKADIPIVESAETLTNNNTQTSSTCDNYTCLIAAAKVCSPISTTITYQNTPVPIFEGLVASGEIKYDLVLSSAAGQCILSFQTLQQVFSMTEAGRKSFLAQGSTETEISETLKGMNDSVKESATLITRCDSTPDVIVSYLGDLLSAQQTGSGGANVSVTMDTTTYTTSTGLKLVCKSNNT